MEFVSIVINVFVTIFALGLVIISVRSYQKSKNVKLVMVCIVFLLFLIKGLILSLGLFHADIAAVLANPYFWLVDLVILLLLFIATLKR